MGMVDKTENKEKNDPHSGSSEIFESIFKEATQEIQKETGKVVTKPKLKQKAEAKAKPEVRPKAPIKLELEPKEEPELELLFEARPETQPVAFKSRQDTLRKPFTRTQAPSEEEKGSEVVPAGPLVRSPLQGQKPKEEPSLKAEKPKPPKKKGKGSQVLKIVLLLVLLAAGVGGASVYLGIIDLSDYVSRSEPATKEAPKIAATKTPSAQTVAKPPEPAAPEAAKPPQPQAKPTDSPKPPAQPQTVQPPQAPPKPAEAVTPPPPPPPPVVQAKPAPAAPPAVAKVETPPPVQAPLKSEPKAPPAPVQQPAVPKKAETPQPGSQPREAVAAKTVSPVSGSGVSFPYSVYLGSYQSSEYVKKALSIYENQGLTPYWSKVELGEKGTWRRVFTGYFRSAQEAEAFIQQKRIKDGEVKETRYANLIATFRTRQEGDEKALALTTKGLSAYWIPSADGQVRLYSGAYITKDGAVKNQAELNAMGIKSEIVER